MCWTAKSPFDRGFTKMDNISKKYNILLALMTVISCYYMGNAIVYNKIFIYLIPIFLCSLALLTTASCETILLAIFWICLVIRVSGHEFITHFFNLAKCIQIYWMIDLIIIIFRKISAFCANSGNFQ